MSTPTLIDQNKLAKVRLPSGRIIEGLTLEEEVRCYRHILHADQIGLVEAIRATRPGGGKKLKFPHRTPEHGDTWLAANSRTDLAEFVKEHRNSYELFVTPATSKDGTPGNDGVSASQVAWVDQDDPTKIQLLREFRHRPHMVVATGGSGGVHAFWRLSYPVGRDEIGAINRKLVAAVDGDRASHNPARILRIPGSFNHKANQHEGADGICRIIWADTQMEPYDPEQLVEGLEDYKVPAKPKTRLQYDAGHYDVRGSDPWVSTTVEVAEGTPPPDYYLRLAGQGVGHRGGHVRCPFHDHEDRNPSTYVYGQPGAGWFCFSCGRGGGPFHLAAALQGWTGGALQGEQFMEAAKTVAAALGTEPHSAPETATRPGPADQIKGGWVDDAKPEFEREFERGYDDVPD